jgi:amino acid transporter
MATAAPARKFGTFLGVYTPSVLTILGVMMYLRFGWVLGNLGLPLALLAVLAASVITLITGLSASAIATNMSVGVGGEYFMISRSLGLEIGGAIGIPLFLCRTLSLTLYAFGLAESIAFLWPPEWGVAPVAGIAAATIVLITLVAGKSADASLKLQLPIMIAVGMSLLALTIGVFTGPLGSPELAPHYERSAPAGFWYVFAVFFPAVTGFTAGIGMSGDLRNPKRSIPFGTIAAILTGAAVYLSIPLLLAFTGRVDGAQLAVLAPDAPPIWTKIAFMGFWFVYPGMWGAILSSAFGSALGGPRVLQALANDGLAPRALGRVSKTGQPTVATWVTGAIALLAVSLGDLNAVGRWVTIFFLTLYVTINLVAATEKIVGNPSFRPTIRVPWIVSLAGSLGAFFVMFLISPIVCSIAMLLELLLYLYLRRRGFESSFGDVRAGFWTAMARFALLKLRGHSDQARNWRPQILAFTANPKSRSGIVRLANWFSQNRGIVTVIRVVEGDLATDQLDLPEMKREMVEQLDEEGQTAFAEVNIVPDFEKGLVGIVQANGFAGLQANTVMFGWPTDNRALARLLGMVRTLNRLQKAVIIARFPEPTGPPERQRIDLWWRGKQDNGDLMLMLAHLLSLNPEWRNARVSLRSVVENEADRKAQQSELIELITEARVKANVAVVVRPPDKTVTQVIQENSRKADVVFLGMMVPEPGEELAYAERLNDFVQHLGAVVLVRNAGKFAGDLI